MKHAEQRRQTQRLGRLQRADNDPPALEGSVLAHLTLRTLHIGENTLGARHGRSSGEVAIARTLRNPAVTGAIVGARGPEQVAGIVGAADFRLSPSEIEEISAFVTQHPYPHALLAGMSFRRARQQSASHRQCGQQSTHGDDHASQRAQRTRRDHA